MMAREEVHVVLVVTEYLSGTNNIIADTVNCSCVGKLFSHSLQSLIPIHILCTGVYAHGHKTLQGMGK